MIIKHTNVLNYRILGNSHHFDIFLYYNNSRERAGGISDDYYGTISSIIYIKRYFNNG